MPELLRIGPLESKRDKAMAVPRLKEELENILELSEEEATHIAIHEFRHAVKDDKPGYYAVQPRTIGDLTAALYEPIGERTKEEMLYILEGPKGDLGMSDMGLKYWLEYEPSNLMKRIFKIMDYLFGENP